MIYAVENTKIVAPLFEGCDDTVILSCIQKIMGEIFADDPINPSSAMAILGDFAFFAGKPDAELVMFKPKSKKSNFVIMVPQNKYWSELICSCHGENAKQVERYAIKKQPGVFDKIKLQSLCSNLTPEISLSLIDRKLYYECLENDWSRDFVQQFGSYERYQRFGLGVAAVEKGKLVSAASSYSSYNGGIEIEVGTEITHRRCGLATACSARLILECLCRGLYPSWDAQNKWSVGLAEKLGYTYSHTYTAFEIRNYGVC